MAIKAGVKKIVFGESPYIFDRNRIYLYILLLIITY